MKKFTVWIAILTMLLGLTACGQTATQDYDRASCRHI